ncbi:MAG: 4-hydroxy-3-methylbut-2-enyl diphosphate reductase [Firmicutes bacterium]|nr:4-hydroxy-3-methylbut-2-enyl diphosphate reductase [Bacillota bacterium]
MEILLAKNIGLCPGVQNALSMAEVAAKGAEAVFCLGSISHNAQVVADLEKKGVKTVCRIEEIEDGATVIIRSHGEGRNVFERLEQKNCKMIDATCPFVKKIHEIVSEYSGRGYQIIIVGDANHPEVIGTLGWCEGDVSATVIDENTDLSFLKKAEKLCLLAQTTFLSANLHAIVKKIQKYQPKTVEFFDTICYTTIARQKEAGEIAKKSDIVLVVGSGESSNTRRLLQISRQFCESLLVSDLNALKNIRLKPGGTTGVLAGASTPIELITEVVTHMSQNVGEVVVSEEMKAGIEETLMSYREGKKVRGTVITAVDKGIRVNIGGKYDGIVYAAEAGLGEYSPADYPAGAEVEAIIVGKKDEATDCILLSKRKIDLIKEGDKVIESIRGGEPFELLAKSATKGGLLGKLGTYTVFIPTSQIKERGFPKDIDAYVGKKMRLTVLDVDDNKHKIVASQRKVIEREREEREEIFWTHVKPNVIVHGTVKRMTNFGAFVSVDGFDCLVHIVDVSWNHIKNVEEVLKKDHSYDFIVLAADRERSRVSLGYKQLQPHPYTVALSSHPVGSVCKGKVVSIVPFGAFVQIEPGIEGLVHVSEASNNYIKSINEVVKVGDEIDVMVLAMDEGSRRITLSIKACLPEGEPNNDTDAVETPEDGRKPRKGREGREGKDGRDGKDRTDEKNSWSEENANNPFANLLKDVEVGGKK